MSSPVEHCRRCDEMHRRAQKNEGAAERYEAMRDGMAADFARHAKHWKSEIKFYRGAYRAAIGLLHKAKVPWDWQKDAACRAERLTIMIQRLVEQRDGRRIWSRFKAWVTPGSEFKS